MTTPTALLQQFQIPVPSFIENLEASFVDDFIKVATVVAIIGIAASIFSVAPVLGVFSGLMLGVCLIARSALDDAADKQITDTALRESEANTRRSEERLAALQNDLTVAEGSASRNAALILTLRTRVEGQEAEIVRLTTSENKLKQELQEAKALTEEIATIVANLRSENADLKKPLAQPTKPVSSRSIFSLGGSARK